jgi:hypothetical protein
VIYPAKIQISKPINVPYIHVYVWFKDDNMDRDVTHKIVYGPKRILWVTDWSINCHLAGSAVNYLLCYTQYMQICQTTCFCYCISKTKTGSDKIRKKTLYWSGPVHIIQLLHLNEINMRFYEAEYNNIELDFASFNIVVLCSIKPHIDQVQV